MTNHIDEAIDAALSEADKLRRAAAVYATLGESVTHTMRASDSPQIRVKLETISKSLKTCGAANFELRRLGDPTSQQHTLMTKVLKGFGIGAIPFSDSLVFVSLAAIPTIGNLTAN